MDCVNAGFEGLNGEADVAAVSHGAALRINEVLGVALVAEQGECAARVVVRIEEQNYEASDDVVHVMISNSLGRELECSEFQSSAGLGDDIHRVPSYWVRGTEC